jgi:hypothetical protein
VHAGVDVLVKDSVVIVASPWEALSVLTAIDTSAGAHGPLGMASGGRRE